MSPPAELHAASHCAGAGTNNTRNSDHIVNIDDDKSEAVTVLNMEHGTYFIFNFVLF